MNYLILGFFYLLKNTFSAKKLNLGDDFVSP